MDRHEWLAEQFEAERPRLRAVAYRMLGSFAEAEDAVQESWLHLSRTETDGIQNLEGWLTTVVARICLDILRARKALREESFEESIPETIPSHEGEADPEGESLLADSVGLALLVVLDTLSPAERLAFVLHDIFGMPFEEIAPIVERTPTAARQLASRARRRVRSGAKAQDAERSARRQVIDAFLAASRTGNFEALLTLLDPNVVFRHDVFAIPEGEEAEIHGATPVAQMFAGRAKGVRSVLVNGIVEGAFARRGQLGLVLNFTITHGKITEIHAILDPARLQQLNMEPLEN